MFKRLFRYFLQGLLYTTPLAVTIYIIITAFKWIDGLLRDLPFVQEGDISKFSFPGMQYLPFLQEIDFSKYSFPGIGVLVILCALTIIGYAGEKLISAPLMSIFKNLLNRAPLIKLIYTSVKDLLSAFVGKDKKFDQPVLVKLDRTSCVERLGFITSTNLSTLGIEDKIAVYLPSSYGMVGELIIVPTSQVTPINANSADVMKFIVSGGISRIQ
jgi:uncharacterized membrane protein